jgi:hypothetical protein
MDWTTHPTSGCGVAGLRAAVANTAAPGRLLAGTHVHGSGD